MYALQRYVLATNSWTDIFYGTWGECAGLQRVTSGYTQIVKANAKVR